MSFQSHQRMFAGVAIVECNGRLVLGDESASLRHHIGHLLTECKQIVLDLGNVTYIDSSGLGVLVGLFASVQRAGGAIKLANLNARTKDILQVTKLLTVFEAYNTAEEAAASFNTMAGQASAAEI